MHRQFDSGVLGRLALIALGRAAGFSLEEIALIFGPDGRPRLDRRMLAAKAEELDRTIRELSAMRDGLRHAAACPAPSHMECPTFRRLLQATVSGRYWGAKEKGCNLIRSGLRATRRKLGRVAKQKPCFGRLIP